MQLMTTAVSQSAPINPATGRTYRVGLVMPLAEQLGGCEIMLLNLLRANQRGPKVDYRVVFLEDGPMVATVKEMGYPVKVIHAGRLRQLHKWWASILILRRWAVAEQVDLLMAFMEKAHLYSGPAAKLAGLPAAWWVHSIDNTSKMIKLANKIPAKLVFCASGAAAQSQQLRKPLRPTTVCYCAVDLDRFDAGRLPDMAEARRRCNLPLDRPIIGIVARLQRWKGVHVFIDAAARVLKARPDALFLSIGGEHALEPGVKEELEAQVKQLNIGDSMKFAGYQADVPLWMQACDVLVHASSGIEPFGTVIIEAMALGKRVIAARAGGPTEYVIEGENGRLAGTGDDKELAEKMLACLNDTDANRQMEQRAKETAAGFSIDVLAQRVADRLPLIFDATVKPSRDVINLLPRGQQKETA
jgi:glycosyltransferase involved in cell wall biosynthesis